MWAPVTNETDLQNILMDYSCDREENHNTDEVRFILKNCTHGRNESRAPPLNFSVPSVEKTSAVCILLCLASFLNSVSLWLPNGISLYRHRTGFIHSTADEHLRYF